MRFKQFKVFTIDWRTVSIGWELDNTSEDLTGAFIEIYRSEFPENTKDMAQFTGIDVKEDTLELTKDADLTNSVDEVKVATLGIDAVIYNDVPETLLHYQDKTYYYRIKITTKSGRFTSAFNYINGYCPDKVVNEIYRRQNILFQNVKKERFILLKKKVSGQRCTSCYSEVLGSETDGSCEVCYGTSFVGGYSCPIIIPGDLSQSQSTKTISATASIEHEYSTFKAPAYPDIDSGDIIIDNALNYYLVGQTNVFKKNTYPISLSVQLLEVPRNTKLPDINVKALLDLTI